MTYFDGECTTCDEFPETILGEVAEERKWQDEKWGQQNHDPAVWLAILGEEVGEANNAFCESHFNSQTAAVKRKELFNMRSELIQVAAVAVAMVESLDRNELSILKNEIESENAEPRQALVKPNPDLDGIFSTDDEIPF